MIKWVTSDTHFYHYNILGYCSRPFKTIEEMNSVLIKNWNNKVKKDDIIYILGDFCFGNKETLKDIVSKLNGRKILVLGNHDRLSLAAYKEAGFEMITKHPIIMNGEYILSHQPIVGELGKFYNIHGHKHRLYNEPEVSNKHIDIGVDCNDFSPINLDDVIKKLRKGEKKKCTTKQPKRRSIVKRLVDLLQFLL